MKKSTQVYATIWIIVLMLFGASITSVTSGNGSIRFMGAKMNMAQGSTYQLYKINDSLAFEIQPNHISVVSYEKTSGLYSFAGDYQHTPVDAPGSVFVVSADYQKDDYVYTSFPMGRTSIVNIKTGETVGKLINADTMGPDGKPVDASQLPEYRQRGLVFADQYKLTNAKIMTQYPPLNTYNDNLFTVQLAFGLIFVLLTLGGIPLGIAQMRQKRAA